MNASPLAIRSIQHRSQARLGLVFPYQLDLIARVKALPGARWSQTQSCWHLPQTAATILDLFSEPSNGYKRQILSCTSLKSLADAKASPTFFALFSIKFCSLSLVHDPLNKSIGRLAIANRLNHTVIRTTLRYTQVS